MRILASANAEGSRHSGLVGLTPLAPAQTGVLVLVAGIVVLRQPGLPRVAAVDDDGKEVD